MRIHHCANTLDEDLSLCKYAGWGFISAYAGWGSQDQQAISVFADNSQPATFRRLLPPPWWGLRNHVSPFNFRHHRITMLHITFIFDRCLRSLAAVTPVKYKCDSTDLTWHLVKSTDFPKGNINFSDPHAWAEWHMFTLLQGAGEFASKTNKH